MSVSVQALLDEGRAALRTGDAVDAPRALTASPSGAVLEGLAHAAYLELDFPRAIQEWERAYAAYRKAGDQMGATRVARTLSGIYFAVVGDRAVSGGWLARAQTLLGDAGYTKDPITAQGISDAFRDAELCSAALDQAFAGERPFAEAMAAYQRKRDTQALPI